MQQENVIALLKETLKFYGEPDNYVNDQIKNDAGHMARFAIEQVVKLEKLTETFVEEYEKYEQGLKGDQTPEEIQNIVNDLMNGK